MDPNLTLDTHVHPFALGAGTAANEHDSRVTASAIAGAVLATRPVA